MRKVLLLICVLGMSCASSARTNSSSWENLNTLHAGEKIQVVEMTSRNLGDVRERFRCGDLAAEEAGPQTIQRQNVLSVKLMKAQHRLRNTLIGAGVGAGAGAGISAAVWEPHGYAGGRGTGAAFGAVIGVVGGAVVGSLWPSHKMIYHLNPQ